MKIVEHVYNPPSHKTVKLGFFFTRQTQNKSASCPTLTLNTVTDYCSHTDFKDNIPNMCNSDTEYVYTKLFPVSNGIFSHSLPFERELLWIEPVQTWSKP